MFVIRHKSSGMCLYPKRGEARNGVPLVLENKCRDPKAVFRWTGTQSLQSVAISGMCVHPFQGSPNPPDGTYLVIYKQCDEPRLAFSYHFQTWTFKHKSSQKCVQPQQGRGKPAPGTLVVLSGCQGQIAVWMQFEFMSKCCLK